MAGSADVRAIVSTTPGAPMLKSMVFGPGLAALESRIAWANEPVPEFAVFVTVNTTGAMRPSRNSSRGRQRCGQRRTCARMDHERAIRHCRIHEKSVVTPFPKMDRPDPKARP